MATPLYSPVTVDTIVMRPDGTFTTYSRHLHAPLTASESVPSLSSAPSAPSSLPGEPIAPMEKGGGAIPAKPDTTPIGPTAEMMRARVAEAAADFELFVQTRARTIYQRIKENMDAELQPETLLAFFTSGKLHPSDVVFFHTWEKHNELAVVKQRVVSCLEKDGFVVKHCNEALQQKVNLSTMIQIGWPEVKK
jgi:hypothetical protein